MGNTVFIAEFDISGDGRRIPQCAITNIDNRYNFMRFVLVRVLKNFRELKIDHVHFGLSVVVRTREYVEI